MHEFVIVKTHDAARFYVATVTDLPNGDEMVKGLKTLVWFTTLDEAVDYRAYLIEKADAGV